MTTSAQPTPARCRDRVVFVVEDDEVIRTTLADVLEEEGYSVRLAANGAEALGLLEAGTRPCLMLVDLMMPVMSGWELVEAVRGDPSLASIPVTIVSAFAGETTTVEGARLLRKPVDLDVLLRTVRDYCG